MHADKKTCIRVRGRNRETSYRAFDGRNHSKRRKNIKNVTNGDVLGTVSHKYEATEGEINKGAGDGKRA